MLSVLRNSAYRRLFTAQVVALVGTGLATVALSLLAYELAGEDASAVLGTAFAIKMIAYVTIAPVIGAIADRIPRRVLMTAMDLIRAGAAAALPFVTEIWQIHVLIFLLQAASAAFTPTFQATVPEILPAERDYTRALSMSRLAYDLESLFSPVLATALLTLVSYDWLFAGTTVGFLASAALVVATALPGPAPIERTGGVRAEALFGIRLFGATPRLRALLALDLAVAAAGAVVLVDTVSLVRAHLDRPAGAVPLALGAYGAGSMVTALLLPRLLRRFTDRAVMLRAAFALPPALAAGAALTATDAARVVLARAPGGLGHDRRRLLGRPDSGGPGDPPLHRRRGPARRVRRPLLPLPRLLAAHLPAGRLARRGGGAAPGRPGPGRRLPVRHHGRGGALARPGPGPAGPRTSGPAARSPAPRRRPPRHGRLATRAPLRHRPAPPPLARENGRPPASRAAPYPMSPTARCPRGWWGPSEQR